MSSAPMFIGSQAGPIEIPETLEVGDIVRFRSQNGELFMTRIVLSKAEGYPVPEEFDYAVSEIDLMRPQYAKKSDLVFLRRPSKRIPPITS